MNILILGRHGFLGLQLLNDLQDCVPFANIYISSSRREVVGDGVIFVDYDSTVSVRALFTLTAPDYIFHLAADLGVKKVIENPVETFKNNLSKKRIIKFSPFGIPTRLWKELAVYSKIKEEKIWAELNNEELKSLATELTSSVFNVSGKSTFKEEFVTAGGVALTEINFKTFESILNGT